LVDKIIKEYEIDLYNYNEFEIFEKFDNMEKACWKTHDLMVALNYLDEKIMFALNSTDEKNVREIIKEPRLQKTHILISTNSME
ncbi:4638_t:CDS:2, partial [Scutellospora calospora]